MPKHISIEVFADHLIFHRNKGPSKFKARVAQRMVDDFCEMIECLMDRCDKYGWDMAYLTTNDDDNCCYDYSVADASGDTILAIQSQLRIHEAQPKELQKLLAQSDIKDAVMYPVIIFVNEKMCNSYESAIDEVDEIFTNVAKELK